MRHRVPWAGLCLLLANSCSAQGPPPPTGKVLLSCDFEGPYSTGEHQVQQGCMNNWQWGRKDMLLKADRSSGRPGTVQMIQVRGLSSGGMQFFGPTMQLKKDRYYRASFWARADGLEGPLQTDIRKIPSPWTTYVAGWIRPLAGTWQRYTFTGQCPADSEADAALQFISCSVGTIWLDDLLVEEATEPFPLEARPTPVLPAGNLLVRSSAEGFRDYLWSGGVYGGPDAEWEDPQPRRAEGGKFGKYCLAMPAATGDGRSFCRSSCLDIIPGRPYTFSAWVRADRADAQINLAVWYYDWDHGGPKTVMGGSFTAGNDWRRFSVTGSPANTPSDQVYLAISPQTPGSTLFVDGLQVEAAAEPTPYAPRYPIELYADLGQAGGNLLEWGQAVPVRLEARAADATALRSLAVDLTILGYPDVPVLKQRLTLPVGKPLALPLQLKRNGLFRLTMTPVNATAAAPQEILFAKLPPPRPTGETSLFGTHITVRPFFINYAWRLGLKWLRFRSATFATEWHVGEPKPGEYQWFDRQVDAVKARGLHIMGMPDVEPEWARTDPATTGNAFDLKAFENYCAAAAEHYRGRIDHWEVWNEPYMGMFYRGSAEQFANVFLAGARGLRRGNPQVTVIGCCTDLAVGLEYARRIGSEARRAANIWSVHHYPNSLTGSGTLPFAVELEDYRKLLAPDGVTRFWNTEGNHGLVGENSFYSFLPATPDINRWAAAFASRTWVEHAKAGFERFFQYTTHQSDTMMYYGGYKLFIGFDRSPTPAAVATATTAWCIDGLKAQPCRPVPGVVQGLLAGNDRAAWVVYDDGGVPGQCRLNLKRLPADARVLDVMGNDPRQDGKSLWVIGQEPLFVVSGKLAAERLAAAGVQTIQD